MHITVLRKMQYGKYIIHILHFGHIFQYLFSDEKGNIYQQYLVMKPSILNIIKYKLNLIESPFSLEEIELGEKVVLTGAIDSVDALIKLQKVNKEDVLEEEGILSPFQIVK